MKVFSLTCGLLVMVGVMCAVCGKFLDDEIIECQRLQSTGNHATILE